jgi:hypothetical protein
MKQLILLQSIGGDRFSLTAGQMVEVDDATGERFLADGLGRGLLSTEPTELQLATKYSFIVSKGSETKQEAAPVVSEPAARPTQRRRRESSSQS